MEKKLPAFTLLELLIASVVATTLFLAATTVMRNYNQILAGNLALAQVNGQHSIVQNFMTRLINNAGYQDLDNGLGNHPGCYLSASPARISVAYDELSGARRRTDLEFVATGGGYRGFDVGSSVIEFSIHDWDRASNTFVLQNQSDGPLVGHVEGFYVSATPSNCNPELLIVGVLLRSREAIFRRARAQSFSSEYFNVASVNSAHIFSYNEFLITPKNVLFR